METALAQLAAGAQKRKAGPLDQLAGGPSSGKRSGQAATAAAAVAEAAAAAAADAGAGAELQQEELTDRSAMHLLNLREAQRELCNQIDAITTTGLQVLDSLRASFLERMGRVKGEVGDLLAQAEGMLRSDSAATLDFRKRIENAGRLIDVLGHRTADVQQRPETLFSAEQEPGAADEGAGEGEGDD